MPLTDTAIRKTKPAAKPQRLFDGGGLYLEIAPAGGKWWRLKYRHGGKEKRLSLGTYPDTSLADARSKRDDARKLLAAGIDPSEQRKVEKADWSEQERNKRHCLKTNGERLLWVAICGDRFRLNQVNCRRQGRETWPVCGY